MAYYTTVPGSGYDVEGRVGVGRGAWGGHLTPYPQTQQLASRHCRACGRRVLPTLRQLLSYRHKTLYKS